MIAWQESAIYDWVEVVHVASNLSILSPDISLPHDVQSAPFSVSGEVTEQVSKAPGLWLGVYEVIPSSPWFVVVKEPSQDQTCDQRTS